MTPTLHIRLLGRPEILLDDHPVHLETTKTLALLAYLVSRPGMHAREQLADLLWGDQGQARAARSLRRALWNIRHVLCDEEEKGTCPYLTVTRREVAFVRHSPYTLDTELFNEHLEAARRIRSSSREHLPVAIRELEHLKACTSLYRGDFMEGIYVADSPTFEAWLLGEQAYYRERVLQTFSRTSEILIARGDYNDAILLLQRLISLEPWSEWAHRQLMFCYALTGRRSDALAQYQRCRDILRKELNAEPTSRTVHLYERIQDPQRFALFYARAHAGRSSEEGSGMPPIPFTGRGREHAWLLEQWKQVPRPLTLVEGEPGVGKTSLVEEVLRHLSGQGVPVLRGRCHPFESPIPFQPIADALRDVLHHTPQVFDTLASLWLVELSRILPELTDRVSDLPPPVALERSALARRRLFEAVAQAMVKLNREGLVLFLDDMHWADADTVDLLRYLFHRLREQRVWFVAAYRVGDMAPGHPFRLLRRDMGRRDHVRTLHLRPLQKEVVAGMVARWPGLLTENAQGLTEYLYADSQGNPFMLIELVRDLVERGLLRREEKGWWVDVRWLQKAVRMSARRRPFVLNDGSRRVPSTVQQMILARVERLPTTAQQALRVAAALGEPFHRDLLHRIVDLPSGDVDAALALWTTRGLIVTLERDPSPRYDFTHPLIRQAVYDALSPAERQMAHARIAQALEQMHAVQEASIVETLAYHYGESPNIDKAIHYLLLAGGHAQARHAQDAAIYFYTRALDRLPADAVDLRYRALSGREQAYHQLARREEQARDLDALWQLARDQGDPIRQAQVLLRRAEWAMRTSQFEESIGYAEEAQRLAATHERLDLAIDALHVKSKCLIRVGETEQARASCEQGLHLAQKMGDPRREVLCLGTLGVAALDMERLEEARGCMEKALTYWRQTEEAWQHAIVCNNLSMVYHRLGDYGRALALQQEARSLIPRTGDLGLDAYSWTSLGVLYHTVGRYEDALAGYKQALELARIISDQSLESYIYACQGDTYLALEEMGAAERAFRKALAMEEAMDVYFYRPQILEGLARCALARGQGEEAKRLLLEAEVWHERTYFPGHINTLALLAYVSFLLGDAAQARAWMTRFQAQASEMAVHGDEPAPEVRWWIIQVQKGLGEDEAAREALRQAYDRLQERAATLGAQDRTSFLTRIPAHRAILSEIRIGQ